MQVCFFLFVFSCNSMAQSQDQMTIATDEGTLIVSKTTSGKETIMFNSSTWDSIATNTAYTSDNLSSVAPVGICITIANRDSNCSRGIGFRCHIFDCPPKGGRIVNAVNRDARATLQKQDDGSVKIIFEDQIDWESLAN